MDQRAGVNRTLGPQVPFLKILLPFALGISTGVAYPVSKTTLLVLELSVLLIWIFGRIQTPYQKFAYGYLRGILLQVLLWLTGIHVAICSDVRNHPDWYGHINAPQKLYIAKVSGVPQKRKNRFVTRLSLIAVRTAKETRPAKGDLLAYLSSDIQPRPEYGHILFFDTRPQPIRAAGNPGSFDFAAYCHRNNLYEQVYLHRQSLWHTDSTLNPDVYARMLKIRDWVIRVLQQYIRSPREAGLAEALLIGYREDLDPELTQLYAKTGVVHIIAISGLHLGIIYAILDFLLTLIPRNRFTTKLKPVVILSALWAFSLLAGGAPSVMRATVMFSFLGAGQVIARKTSSFNLLFASAFFLLVYNPRWLCDTGFQLSYAALSGILLLQRPIFRWLQTGYRLPDSIINLCAVTLAAQVMTAPLTVYYFKQFPVYFLWSNLAAVPLSSIILVGAILLCATAGWPAAASLLGTLVKAGITLMNTCISFLDQLPGAVWAPLQITGLQVLLLYLILGMGVFGMYDAAKRAGYAASLGALLFFSLRAADIHQCRRQQRIVIYNIPRAMAVDFMAGHTAYSLADRQALTETNNRNITRDCRHLFRIKQITRMGWDGQESRYFRFGGMALMLIRGTQAGPVLTEQEEPVVLCLNSPEYIPQDSLPRNVRQVVICGSTPRKIITRWVEEGARLGIPVHPVVDKGAFVMTLH